MKQELNIAYIFSCIMVDNEKLTLPVASKKIKHFINKSQGLVDENELDEWREVEEELIHMDLDSFENWKKIAISYFKSSKNVLEK